MELLTLILVDDEPIILKGLLETYDWAKMGFCVVGSARNGEAALDLIREKQPDVVLTDVRMKRMDGLTLIRRAREEQFTANFVVLSAYRDFEYAQEACRNGALSYLVKPVDEEELARTMGEVYEFCAKKKFKEKNYSIWEKILLEDKDNFLNQMVSRFLDDGISEEELADLFVSLMHTQETGGHHFAAAAVGIDLACRVKDQKEYEMKQYLLETQIYKNLKEKYRVWTKKSQDGISCFLVDLGDSRRVEGLRSILMEMRQELKEDLVSAMAGPECGLSGMKQTYRQVLCLFEAASEAGAGLLTAPALLTGDASGKTQYSIDIETQILAAIRKNDREQLRKMYEKFVYTLPGEERAGKVWLHRLAVRTEFYFEDINAKTEQSRNSFCAFYESLEQNTLLKLVDVLYQLFCSLIEQRLQSDRLPAEEYFRAYIASAVTYIQEHLAEETLSISEVSERIFLNSVYFGRIFKKETGVSFKRYVQNARIEKAKELLLGEQEAIAGICLKVGIPNPSYFSQLFKQSTGMLPSEYKRSLE